MTEENLILTTAELADELCITPVHVNRLVNDGVLDKYKKGRFFLRGNVKKFILYKESQKRNVDSDNQVDYWNEKALHEKAKRQKSELELAELQGNMHRSEDVEHFVGELIYAYKSQLLSLPGLLAPELAGMESVAEISEIIKKEAVNMLNSLASYKYDNEKYKFEVRERQGWSSEDEETD